MLARWIATVAALLLACASPQASAYVRAERVSVSLADLAVAERLAPAVESASPAKTASTPKTAPPARARAAEPASGKNAALTHCRIGENWSPLQKCASMPGVYQWDGTRLAGRTNATGSTLGDYQHAYGGAISSREGAVRSTLHTDVHGTPQLITDGTAAIAGWTRTDVWGVEKAQSGAQSRLGHTGYLKDPLLGDELYAQARQYRAGTGRFTSRDEWGGDNLNPITLNKYLYGNGNPGSYVDPTGNCAEPVTAAICALGLATVATAAVEYARLSWFGNDDEKANAGQYAVQNATGAALTTGAAIGAAALTVETGGAAAPFLMNAFRGAQATRSIQGAYTGIQAAYVANAPRALAAAESVALAGAGAAGTDLPSITPRLPLAPSRTSILTESSSELDARFLAYEPQIPTNLPAAASTSSSATTAAVTAAEGIGASPVSNNAPLLLTHTPTTDSLAKIRRMPSPGNWRAGEQYVQELYGSAGQQHFAVPSGNGIVGSGGRFVDAPVLNANGGTIANEVKTYKRWITLNGQASSQAVPLSDHIRQQVLKDVWLRQNVPGYDPRYIFLDAPPSTELSDHLSQSGIIHVIHH